MSGDAGELAMSTRDTTPGPSTLPDGVYFDAHGVHVNRARVTTSAMHLVGAGFSNLQSIDFEVIVRVESRTGSEAKIGVLTAIVGAGVKGESKTQEGQTATLRFKVPICFPADPKPSVFKKQ